ncbi:GTP-binding protein [Clostridium sp.]|uniref:GTP-binding protein n=1 Tax=Clostridium sp. TaxID=1506 RepID=UPI003216A76E
MNTTPNSNRTHIAIYGKTNVGKSSLLNKILGQEVSIVSDVMGTTTDPVSKAMELIPIGPVLFIDTAGLWDDTELGALRGERTLEIMKRTDLALYVMDSYDIDMKAYEEIKLAFKKYNVPHILVVSKVDTLSEYKIEELKNKFLDGIFISSITGEGIETLKEKIIEIIQENQEELPIIGDLLPYNSKVVLVVRDTELESALEDIKDVDLVITDSQAFKKVDKIVPSHIKLTSFSILLARHKGDLSAFVEGVHKIKELNKDSRILISESCSHNVSHEDIGRAKIPKLLNKHLGCDLNYEYRVGHDFPEDIEKYDLIIHCGACMINRKTVINRINQCKDKGVAITNYGVILAYLTGILDRTLSIY